MKKLLFTVFTACLFIPAAQAAVTSTVVKAADLLPAEIDIVFEINTAVTNPVESTMLDLIKKAFEESSTTDKSALIDSVFANNTVTFALNDEGVENYLMFNCKASDLLGLSPDGYTQEIYNGYTITSNTNNETYGSFIKNVCVFSNLPKGIRLIIDNASSANYQGLSSLTGYKNFQAKKDANSFLSLFMNPSSLPSDASVSSSLMSALNTEGISASQTTDGLKLNLYIEGDATKLTDLNYALNKYVFTPKLYSKISGNKLIFYVGGKDFSGSMMDSLNLLADDSEVKQIFEEMLAEISVFLGINVETDLLPILTGELLIAVHDSGNIMPAFTAVFDVNGNISKAQTTVAAINKQIKETNEAQEISEQTEFYANTTKIIQGTTFTEHKFTDPVDPTAEPFYLYIGVSNDGLMVISTHPNLTSIYKSDAGLTVNTTFKNYFTNPTESIKEIFFMDVDALKNYIVSNMTKAEASQSDIEDIEAVLGPWHNVYSKIYATQNQEWGDILVKVDLDKLTGLAELLNESFNMYTAEPIVFCDVNESDWFYSYVSQLSAAGVVEGYPDGCFKPGNEITRAEFTKMVLMKKGYQGDYQDVGLADFRDINGDEWYADYVNEAAINNYVKGYEDGTFRPNDPITRAEALQIISNVNLIYDVQFMQTEEPFNDVNETDWFYNAVNTSYNMGVVQGIDADTFEPQRHLTRAEAAKMLSLGI